MNKEKKYIYLSGLNGLRTIAALSVLISHIALSIKQFNVSTYLFGLDEKGNPNSWYLGSMGVTIFFVLSGFLITYLLLLEQEKGVINVKKFYIRRILRIWPIYYLYLFISLLFVYFIYNQVDLHSTLFYVFFAANIPFVFGFSLQFVSHFWSIGVEEQFYLFWPWFVKKIKKRLLLTVSVIILFLIFTRLFLWWKFPFSDSAIFSIVNRFDCMMIGAIGAILYYQKNGLFLKFVDNKISQVLAWGIIFLLAVNIKLVNSIVDTTLVAIVSLLLIVGQINIKNRIVNLDFPVFNFLGKISYGIYVYHVLIIYLVSLFLKDLQMDEMVKTLLVYLIIILITLVIAHFSYELFEKRFIRLKDKFAVVKSTSSSSQNE